MLKLAAVPKYEQDIDSISDLNSKKSTTSSNTGNSSNSFGKSVDWTIQGTDARNGVMKQTKSELDDGQLDKYSLKESSDQDQFKTIQKAYKQQNLSSLLLWNQVGSLRNLILKC